MKLRKMKKIDKKLCELVKYTKKVAGNNNKQWTWVRKSLERKFC